VQEAVRLEPSNMEAHINLAAAHAARGRFDLAARAIETALRLNPSESVVAVLRERREAYRRGVMPSR
jgi:Flp pilus assembly protein TadD